MAEAEVAAANLDVLAEWAIRKDRCLPWHDAVGAAVHRRRGEADWHSWPINERTAQRDHAAHTMRRVPSEGAGVDTAEAPADQADAPSVRVDEGGQQLIQIRRTRRLGPVFLPMPHPCVR